MPPQKKVLCTIGLHIFLSATHTQRIVGQRLTFEFIQLALWVSIIMQIDMILWT